MCEPASASAVQIVLTSTLYLNRILEQYFEPFPQVLGGPEAAAIIALQRPGQVPSRKWHAQ
jgi:hypothetical protein